MPTADELAAFLEDLDETYQKARAAYQKWWEGKPYNALRDGTFMSVLYAGARTCRKMCVEGQPGFNPENYAAWYAVLRTSQPEGRTLECDFPEPFSLKAMLERIVAGIQPGSRPEIPLSQFRVTQYNPPKPTHWLDQKYFL